MDGDNLNGEDVVIDISRIIIKKINELILFDESGKIINIISDIAEIKINNNISDNTSFSEIIVTNKLNDKFYTSNISNFTMQYFADKIFITYDGNIEINNVKHDFILNGIAEQDGKEIPLEILVKSI